MAKSWLYRSCIGLALACVSMFATAYEYVAPMARYVAYTGSTGFVESVAKFDAELIASHDDRTTKTARVNGLVKESNGYRFASMVQADGPLLKVGWHQSKV